MDYSNLLEKPEQLFLLLNLWSSASKTFIVRQFLIQDRQWQHSICLNAREATLNVECREQRGLLPGPWTFLSGGREAVDGRISPRLSPAQPGRGTCSQSLCQDFPLFSSSHRASLHGVSIPALFSLGLVLWWQYLGTKRIRGVPTPVPSYHILGRST